MTDPVDLTVRIGSILHAYTDGASEVPAEVPAEGADVGAVLDDLDRRHPGIAFRVVDERGRIRPHVKLFLDQALVTSLSQPVPAGATLHILGALSGG